MRDGGWRRLSAGPFQVLVALAGALDVFTTTHILLNGHAEANELLTWLADVDPRLAVTYFAISTALVVGVCWLDLGWLPAVLGTTVIVAYGSGGVHNVFVLAAGWSPKAFLPIPLTLQIHYVEPALGVAAGVLLARHRFGELPWREIAVYGAIVATDLLVKFQFW